MNNLFDDSLSSELSTFSLSSPFISVVISIPSECLRCFGCSLVSLSVHGSSSFSSRALRLFRLSRDLHSRPSIFLVWRLTPDRFRELGTAPVKFKMLCSAPTEFGEFLCIFPFMITERKPFANEDMKKIPISIYWNNTRVAIKVKSRLTHAILFAKIINTWLQVTNRLYHNVATQSNVRKIADLQRNIKSADICLV